MSAVAICHPRLTELVARRMLRGKIERAVDRLLAILDDLDGDPDLEPTNGGAQEADRNPATADAEPDAGDEPEIEDEHADRADYEPSLGAPERHHDQRRWAVGGQDDREVHGRGADTRGSAKVVARAAMARQGEGA